PGRATGQPGLHRPGRAGVPRADAARAGLAGAGGSHGADQLPAAVAGRGAAVPWLRARTLGIGPRLATAAGGAGVRRPGRVLALVAGAVPPRTGGVAVARGHLPSTAADAPRLSPGLAARAARDSYTWRMGTRDDVLVVGGGVVGLACGLALAERGRQVRVVDAGRIAGGSSHGNCGTLTPSHALPLAAPGAVGKALRWMLVPDAPLYMKPRFDPALWSWLLRFAGRCNGRAMMRSAAARIALLQASREAFPEWIAGHGIDCHFVERGTDHVFRDARALEAYLPELRALAEVGVASEVIDGAEYERQAPAVLPGVAGTVRYPGDASLRPDRYAAGLAKALQAADGSLVEHCEVRGLEDSAGGIRVATSTGEFHAGDVVMAVGAWSPKLARALKLPHLASVMQPGKGYSITYDRPALAPQRPLTLQERSVCVSIWASGYRLGSTMEFSGFDTSVNRRRLG